jgi:hypothetical protein
VQGPPAAPITPEKSASRLECISPTGGTSAVWAKYVNLTRFKIDPTQTQVLTIARSELTS